jgi:ATP-dependent DNA helicase RecQ
MSVFRQLVAHGLLEVDHGGHGGLLLAASARAVLKGETSVTLRHQAPKAKKSGKSAKSTGGAGRIDHAASLDGAALARWEALRGWRADAAKEHGVPAYVIFHDSTLAELARRAPESRDELGAVPGIGSAKLERYADALLNILATA